MYINSLGCYIPKKKISNQYFFEINGLTDEWLTSRTGIKERSRTINGENTTSMAIEATKNAAEKLNYPIQEVDLIIGASYTHFDMVSSFAHEIQRHFNIEKAKAFVISAACSSLVNAVEIAQTFLETGRAKKILIVASEHNSGYSDDKDQVSGHLWGDGAAAMFLTNEKTSENNIKIIDIETHGLGNLGKSTEAIHLRPNEAGLKMPDGRDVFIHACNCMTDIINELLERNNFSTNHLDYLIPHQANTRIMSRVAKELNLPCEKIISNIDRLGNTGCASTLIALCEEVDKFKKDELIGITVFGGGYSSGGILMKK